MRLPPPRHHARRTHALPQRRECGVGPAAEKVIARGELSTNVPLVALEGGLVEEGCGRGGAVPREDEGAVVVLGEFVLRESVGPQDGVFEVGEDGLNVGGVGGRGWVFSLG